MKNKTNNPNLLTQAGWGNLFQYKNMTIAWNRLFVTLGNETLLSPQKG